MGYAIAKWQAGTTRMNCDLYLMKALMVNESNLQPSLLTVSV
jgi:hypothetical protein